MVRGFRALVGACLVLAPLSAFAHARLVSPAPRDTADNHKSGPCGAVPRTTTYTQLEAGATIPVTLREGINHVGCFQIAISPNNDENFITLVQFADDGGTGNQNYVRNVTLPAGMTCANCTLQLRQLMQGTNAAPGPACAPDASPDLAIQGTYYSCADIRVGSFDDAGGTPLDPDAAVFDDDASTGNGNGDGGEDDDMGGSSGGAAPARRGSTADSGSCSVVLGATSGVSAAITAVAFGLALARRRRKKQ